MLETKLMEGWVQDHLLSISIVSSGSIQLMVKENKNKKLEISPSAKT